MEAQATSISSDARTIAANFEWVCERIRRAAERARRDAHEITLVAVSKTFPAESIRWACAAGVCHFGENRVQEWESKHAQVADLAASWHLVGHLQSNKAARAVRLFDSIDSLDSIALARRLDRAAGQIGDRETGPQSRQKTPGALPLEAASRSAAGRLRVLMEVRLALEDTKSGVTEAELPRLAEAVLLLPHVELRGLMCIPPYFEDPEETRPYFRRLRELRDSLATHLGVPLPELSMGMSHDFEAAIEEGATQIRLGTALFGPRGSA